MRVLQLTVLLTCTLTGCGSPTEVEPKVQIRENRTESKLIAEQSNLPLGTSPEYANWSRFPVGTEVKRTDTTTNGETTVSSTKSMKLIERTDDRVTIEWSVTTKRSDGFESVNPPNTTVHQKSFRIPKGMKMEDFTKPSLNAKESGTEQITILGKQYEARIFEWKNGTEGGDMLVKAWLSDEFPGRILRQEMNVPNLKRSTTDEVVAVNIPKS